MDISKDTMVVGECNTLGALFNIEDESMIKTHKELAKLIEGKRILHLNSMGKDSVLCLEWLTTYAKPECVVSLFFRFQAEHPDDDRYWRYLHKRYPKVKFITEPNSVELTLQAAGVYQSPLFVTHVANHFDWVEFERGKQIAEVKQTYALDYVCDGSSKYEDFSRRTKFHQKGLEFRGTICPLGMMSKKEVIGAIKACGVKLHPCYKFAPGTYDHPSYWKIRGSWIGKKGFKESVLHTYPLLVLDQYRYEVLLKKG